jgi:uncharacterized membrane protein
MGEYLGDKPYDFGVMVFDGQDTANEAFEAVKSIEDRTEMKIQDAAVFHRNEKGKIKLNNKGFVAGWKGGTIGLGIGLLLGGPVGGAVVGGLIGFGRGNDRRNLRGLVNDKLGLHQSALAVVLENTDRDAVEAAMKGFDAEAIYTELQGETLAKLEELTEDDDVTAEAEEAFEEIDAE